MKKCQTLWINLLMVRWDFSLATLIIIRLSNPAPQLNFGLLPMLQLNAERPVNAANYWVQAVVGKSPRQNEAWGLIDYLAHSPANKIYLDATNRQPPCAFTWPLKRKRRARAFY